MLTISMLFFLLGWDKQIVSTRRAYLIAANFLTGAQKPIFEAFHVLHIVETCAIAAVLPEQFSFDRGGQKASWRRRFLDRAKQLVNQQKGVPLKGSWDLAKNCRLIVSPSPLPAPLVRRKVYFYPTYLEVQSRLKEFADKEKLLVSRQHAVDTAEKAVQECRVELSIIIAEGRDPDMKLTVGAERFGKVKSIAKTELLKAEKTKAEAVQALNRVKGTILSYIQTEDEYKKFVSSMKSLLLSDTMLTPGMKLWEQRVLPDDEKFLDPNPILRRSERSRAVKGLDIAADIMGRQAELDAIRHARRSAAPPAIDSSSGSSSNSNSNSSSTGTSPTRAICEKKPLRSAKLFPHLGARWVRSIRIAQ